MGRLTTHVLDVHLGRPAAGLEVELWRLHPVEVKLKAVTTNADGRLDAPLLEGPELKSGVYELRFQAGHYLRREGATLAAPAFLGVIPIRFGIANVDQHYHVPLLLSAHGYSTYRGS